jgi:hypothetical protein
MIAIAFLFICVLCDCFKSRRRLVPEAGPAIAELKDFPSQSRGGDCVD